MCLACSCSDNQVITVTFSKTDSFSSELQGIFYDEGFREDREISDSLEKERMAETEERAKARLEERKKCDLKPDPGSCKALIKKYYYDSGANSCREFFWGGCDGVVPFDTLDSCRPSCIPLILQ